MSDVYRTFILFLIFVFIIVQIVSIITLLKNKELIRNDPLNYGMKLHNFTSCSCFDNNGKSWDSVPSGGFKRIEYSEEYYGTIKSMNDSIDYLKNLTNG